MNYAFYIIISFAVICAIFFPIIISWRLKNSCFSQIAIRCCLKQNNRFFCSYAIQQAVWLSIRKKNKRLSEMLLNGKVKKAASLIKPYNELLAIVLEAFQNPVYASSKLEKFIKKNPENKSAIAYLAMLYFCTQNIKQQAVWDNIIENKLPIYFRAQYKMHIAKLALKNGDLEFASQNFYLSAKLFNRCKAYYEEANVYLLLGTTYRICFIFDVAESLFRSALRIFTTLKLDEICAKTYANLGMLMVAQERFEEANHFFQKALSYINIKKHMLTIAEIFNQQALMLIIQKKYKEAEAILKESYIINSEQKNINGIAFSLELKANSLWKRKKFVSAAKNAQKASDLYLKIENISGMLESMYLQAQALFCCSKDVEAENVLRQIIKKGKEGSGCFHLANAYNLLGIIFVQRKDLRRAKGLFQQSLDLEQRGCRCSAIATDYANIGFIEMRYGNKGVALKNLHVALDFAQQAEDEELYSLISHHIENINS